MQSKYVLVAFAVVLLASAVVLMQRVGADEGPVAEATGVTKVGRGPFVRGLRLTGIIESVRYHSVAAPRLVGVSGPGANTLIITKLVRGGSQVAAGDLLV